MVKNGFTIKELSGHPWESTYIAPKNYKPYVKLIKEDFKHVDNKAKAEMYKAFSSGFTADYILGHSEKDPVFDWNNGFLTFVKNPHK